MTPLLDTSETGEPQEADRSGSSNLPLPDPYPEYITCPHCGELEVEVYCYQPGALCHACGQWIVHQPPDCFGTANCCARRQQPGK